MAHHRHPPIEVTPGVGDELRLYENQVLDTPPPPVMTPPDIKSTVGKLWNHTFSAGIENIETGKYNFSPIIGNGTCIIFDGERKITTGKQQKQGRESALNSNLAGKHIFLAGRPFTLAGQRFSGVVTGGCLD